MIHNILRYSILFSLLFGFFACDNLIFDKLDDTLIGSSDDEDTVYILITRAAHLLGEESINEDGLDFEDRVHDLAMFVFDNTSGNLVSAPYFESNIPFTNKNKTFVVQLTPGQRDFYFIANMPKSELETITTRSALESYMKLTKELHVSLLESHYLNATEDIGFPMSRIYTNQTITKSGSIYTPTPFKPDSEDRVKLRRVVAQLQVDIEGTAINSVKNVYYKNAFRHYSLLSLDDPISSPDYYVDVTTNNALRNSGNSYIYYMPEALMTTPTTPTPPTWTGAVDHKPINYFVIETLTGTTYEIPIVTYEDPIPGGNYLSFARGLNAVKPDYNIYRNNRYVFKIKSLEDIQIDYVVNPWELIESAFYMGYGYNVGVDDEGNVSVSNTVNACAPHKITLKTISPFTFDDSTTEKVFVNALPSASATYIVTPIPISGETYLQVEYNDVLVKTFTK